MQVTGSADCLSLVWLDRWPLMSSLGSAGSWERWVVRLHWENVILLPSNCNWLRDIPSVPHNWNDLCSRSSLLLNWRLSSCSWCPLGWGRGCWWSGEWTRAVMSRKVWFTVSLSRVSLSTFSTNIITPSDLITLELFLVIVLFLHLVKTSNSCGPWKCSIAKNEWFNNNVWFFITCCFGNKLLIQVI